VIGIFHSLYHHLGDLFSPHLATIIQLLPRQEGPVEGFVSGFLGWLIGEASELFMDAV
jgi:hypothetical protein